MFRCPNRPVQQDIHWPAFPHHLLLRAGFSCTSSPLGPAPPSNRSFRPTRLWLERLELLDPVRSTSTMRVVCLGPQQQHIPSCMKAPNKLHAAATHIKMNAILPIVGITVLIFFSISLWMTAHWAVVTAAARNVVMPEQKERSAMGTAASRERRVMGERKTRRKEEKVVAKKAPKVKWEALRIRST